MHSGRYLLGRSRTAWPVFVGASLVEARRPLRTTSRLEEGSQDGKDRGGEVFDITKKWESAQNDARDFWRRDIFTETTKEGMKEETEPKQAVPFEAAALEKVKQFWRLNQKESSSSNSNKKDGDSATNFMDMAVNFAALLAGGGSEESVQRIVKQARESAEEGDIADKKSLEEMLTLLRKYANALKVTADKFLVEVDLTKLYPTSLFYFVEREDSIKNPSWKRRMHRFYSGIDVRYMDELNDFLQLAQLSYGDTVEEIHDGLENNKTPFEVVFVDTESQPNRPAHFIAVKRNQSKFSPYLEILLSVRGTKTIEDAITDLLCDYEPYKGGLAHSGVLEGGKHLTNKHKKLLLTLLKSSGKHKIKLTCVGHSLGAGCAAIVGMELKGDPNFEVQVIGFGCPALLSKELSEQTQSYITTVVSDDDCVPRLSAASVVNALLDITEYDYLPSARRDVKHAMAELQRLFPSIVTKALSSTIVEVIDPLLDQFLGGAIKEPTSKRMDPVLFPPGKIIHFYRDGVGITGSVVPCDFFGELHISRRMVDDHLFFTGYQQIFLELMRQQHQDHNFNFENSSHGKR